MVKRGKVRLWAGHELSGYPTFIYTCPYCGYENERQHFALIIKCARCGRLFHVA